MPEVDKVRAKLRKAKWFQKNKRRIYRKRAELVANNPMFVKQRTFRYYLKSQFGITPETYTEMLTRQEGKCAICRRQHDENGRPYDKLYIDHNHTTGVIRGLLCMSCNAGVGHFKENLTILQNAIDYLTDEKSSDNSTDSKHSATSECGRS